MIVADANLIAYCWLKGPHTDLAHAVRQKDPDWHVPTLWRSEFRSVLAGFMRNRSLTLKQAQGVISAVENELAGAEHDIESTFILELVNETKLSAYDCEYIALALILKVPLVTTDRAILKAFPQQALTMEAFVETG